MKVLSVQYGSRYCAVLSVGPDRKLSMALATSVLASFNLDLNFI